MNRVICASVAATLGICGVPCADAQILSYTKLVSVGDAVPGSASTFTGFYDLSIENGSVLLGAGGTNGLRGLYFRPSGSSAFSMVADTNTQMPGRAVNFSRFQFPTQSGGDIAFTGLEDGLAKSGIYKRVAGGALSMVVDSDTPRPSSPGNFSSLYDSNTVLSGGQIAFNATQSGDGGVYVASPSGVVRAVARTDLVPGTSSQIGSVSQTTGFAYRNGAIAMATNFLTSTDAIVRSDNGVLSTVAIDGQQAPGSTSTFRAFYSPRFTDQALFFMANVGATTGVYAHTSTGLRHVFTDSVANFVGLSGSSFLSFAASGDDCLFTGGGGNSTTGYDRLVLLSDFGARVETLLSAGDMFDGKTLLGVSCYPNGLDGNTIVFRAAFTDGSMAVYSAIVPAPASAAVLLALGGGVVLRRRHAR